MQDLYKFLQALVYLYIRSGMVVVSCLIRQQKYGIRRPSMGR
jgi:hypothetical protein